MSTTEEAAIETPVAERPDLGVMPLMLCDFAQIRDGLLFVSSGGVSRVYRQALPARLGLYLSMVVDVSSEVTDETHEMEVAVTDRAGSQLAGVDVTFRVGDEGVFHQERQHVPFVVSLQELEVTTWGTHEVTLRLDGLPVGSVSVYVLPSEAF